MPEHEFEIYLSVLSRLVKLNPDQKAAIADELRDHLEERFEELVRGGQDRDEAIRQALDEFGEASGLALDLTTVSKKRIPRWVIRSTAVSASVAMLLLAWMFLFAPPHTIPNGPSELSAQQPIEAGALDGDHKANVDANKPAPKPAKLVLNLGKDDLEAAFLNKRVAMEFIDKPLTDVAKFISQQIDEAVLIDVAALDDQGLPPDEPITFSAGKPVASAKKPADPFGTKEKSDKTNKGVEKPDAKQERPEHPEVEHAIPPLSESLSIMLDPHGLTWHVADGILRITTNEQLEEIQITQNYNIEALLTRGISSNEIIDAVRTLAAGRYWQQIDGAGGELMIVQNILSVRHDYQSQREIRDVLRAIVEPAPQRFVRQHDTTIATIELLSKKVNVNFIDTPLQEAVKTLAQLAIAPIRLDVKALNDEGLAADTPVTLQLKDKSLETVLDVMLAPLDFTFTIRHGEIFITSLARAEDELLLGAVYQLPTRDEVGRQKIQNSLQEMTSGIWANIDGEGGELMTLEDGTLCVWQSYKVQREIEQLLALYRQSLQPKQELAANANELVTKFYRVPMETALDLIQVLPEYVEENSWYSDTNPGGGTIQVISLGRKSSGRSAPRSNTGANSKKKKSGNADEKKKKDSAAKTSQVHPSLPFLRDGVSPEISPTADAAILAQFGGGGFGGGGGFVGTGQNDPAFGDFSNYAEEAVLVIRQTPIVHGKIDRFLLSLGLRTVGKTHVSESEAKTYGATHGGQPQFGGGGGGGFFSIRNRR